MARYRVAAHAAKGRSLGKTICYGIGLSIIFDVLKWITSDKVLFTLVSAVACFIQLYFWVLLILVIIISGFGMESSEGNVQAIMWLGFFITIGIAIYAASQTKINK